MPSQDCSVNCVGNAWFILVLSNKRDLIRLRVEQNSRKEFLSRQVCVSNTIVGSFDGEADRRGLAKDEYFWRSLT